MSSPDDEPSQKLPDAIQMERLVSTARSLLPPMQFSVNDPDAELAQIDPSLVDPDNPIEPYITGHTHASYPVEDGWVDINEHANGDNLNSIQIDHTVPDKKSSTPATNRVKSFMVDIDTLKGQYREKLIPDLRQGVESRLLTESELVRAVLLSSMVEFSDLTMRRYTEAVRLLGRCGLT